MNDYKPKNIDCLSLRKCERGFIVSDYPPQSGMISKMWAFGTLQEVADWMLKQAWPADAE